MWPLVLLPRGDKVRPLLLSSAAALPSLSVGERSISGLALLCSAAALFPSSVPEESGGMSSFLAGMDRGHYCFPRQPRILHLLLLSEAAVALPPWFIAGHLTWEKL